MSMDIINFQELKDTPQKKWLRAKNKGGNAIVLEDDNNNEYLVENVTVEEVGSHLSVSDGDERIFIKKYRGGSPWSPLFLLIIPLTMMLAAKGTDYIKSHYFHRSVTDQDIQSKINELQSIQSSMKNLSSYIVNQKQNLEDTASLLDSVKKEKNTVEAALKIDKQQLNSLLETMQKDAGKDKWIERVISFVTGVISSLIAAKIWQSRSRATSE